MQFAITNSITNLNEKKTDMDIFSALQTQQIVPSANSADNGQTTADVARERAEEQRVNFLNILLTQLANQNPLDPMDTDEFASQLTRFSILEQGIVTNENLTYFIIGAILSMPFLPWCGRKLLLLSWIESRGIIFYSASSLLCASLFLVCAMYIMAGTYNPFIYFRF
jgi:hypothetical protein